MYRICMSLLAVLYFLPTNIAVADPWFTGPLLAPAPHTTAAGHVNSQFYGFYVDNIGTFNRHSKLVHTGASQSLQFNPDITFGLTDWMDFELNLPYSFNRSQGKRGEYIGDLMLTLGFQALNQSSWLPNLRITLNEILPTGRYDNLNPVNQGTDGTGMGSYQTAVVASFEYLEPVGYGHYLDTILSLNYTHAARTKIQGLSTYGGSIDTNGGIRPGNLWSIDLATQFSITQNWAAVMEGYYFSRQAAKFHGYLGSDADAMLGSPPSAEISIAPAVEYSFTENYGIIAGVWWSLKGKSASHFITPSIAFNAYW